MQTLLSQLESLAGAHGVTLSAACEEAGVAQTTLMRWQQNIVSPRESTAQKIAEAIEKLSAHPPTEAAE